MTGVAIMRTSMWVIMGVGVATPACAQVTFFEKQEVFADCMKSRFPGFAPTYQQAMAERDVCNRVVDEKFAGMVEIPRTPAVPTAGSRDYEIEAFLLREQLNSDLEAVNREYRLRRSGLLP